METKINCDINCRQCPSRHFEISPVMKCSFGPSRFIAICHAVEVVLHPIFPDNTPEEYLTFINKANLRTVQFEPVDNCPNIKQLREEGKIPWARGTIDFSKH